MVYSVKIIENILLSELQKQSILASALNDDTQSNYNIFDNIDTIKEILNQPEYSQALEAFKKKRRILRGDMRNENIMSAIVMPGIRKSKSGYNIYTRLISDILPSWTNYPKRNRGTICSTNREYASSYAHDFIFYIFPQNNTSIGVCLKHDIWMSFPFVSKMTGCKYLDYFEKELVKFLSYTLKINDNDITRIFQGDTSIIIQTLEDAVALCNKDNKHMEKELQNISSYCATLCRIVKEVPIIEYLDYILNPEKNKFQLVGIDKVPPRANHELWFEGQYLMIREDIISKVIKLK